MNNLAIIPARAGSKGIPHKNINLLAGKPLVQWTIEHALASKHIDRIIVSTDSQDIADIAFAAGAEVPFLRPDSLSGDHATTESCIVHALDWLEEHEQYHPDNVVLMQCTSPIREEGTIDTAFELFFADDCDSMLTVSPFWHFLWNSPEKPAASYDFQNRPRRQDIPSQDIKYRENGSFYITKTEIYRACNNRLGGKIGMHVMSEEEGYEIDTPTDWLINEAILSNKVR